MMRQFLVNCELLRPLASVQRLYLEDRVPEGMSLRTQKGFLTRNSKPDTLGIKEKYLWALTQKSFEFN